MGDVVYLSGSNTVAKANATSLAKMPAVGIVKTKPTAVTCTVQDDGEFTTAGGLTVGVNYFVSTTVDGAYTTVVPSANGSVLQILGFARNSTSLELQVSRSVIVM